MRKYNGPQLLFEGVTATRYVIVAKSFEPVLWNISNEFDSVLRGIIREQHFSRRTGAPNELSLELAGRVSSPATKAIFLEELEILTLLRVPEQCNNISE